MGATDSISRGPGAELGSGICAGDVDRLDFDSLTTRDGRLRWWVLAATRGRSALAKMAHGVVRNRWMSDVSRENVDSLKGSLGKRPKLTFGLFLFYAFAPLPSNFVFIAYGPTTMHLARLAIPFFLADLPAISGL